VETLGQRTYNLSLDIAAVAQNPSSWIMTFDYILWLFPIPSGKLSHNYGKSPCFMGKSTISMAIFNSYFDITRGYIRWSLFSSSPNCGFVLSSRPWWWLQHGELCPNHPLGSSLSTRWSRWWGPAVPQYIELYAYCSRGSAQYEARVWAGGRRGQVYHIIHISYILSYIYIPAGILIWLLSATSLHGQITIWLFNIAMENPL